MVNNGNIQISVEICFYKYWRRHGRPCPTSGDYSFIPFTNFQNFYHLVYSTTSTPISVTVSNIV